MNRHNQSNSSLHERQLELHRQTTPELTHNPKTLLIDHMKTLCHPILVARTKEEIYHRKDRATSEDRSLEVAGFTRVPARNSFSGFNHQYTVMFRQGVHNNMRTQMNIQDIHTNMLRQHQ
jgi:hypothetical protein